MELLQPLIFGHPTNKPDLQNAIVTSLDLTLCIEDFYALLARKPSVFILSFYHNPSIDSSNLLSFVGCTPTPAKWGLRGRVCKAIGSCPSRKPFWSGWWRMGRGIAQPVV